MAAVCDYAWKKHGAGARAANTAQDRVVSVHSDWATSMGSTKDQRLRNFPRLEPKGHNYSTARQNRENIVRSRLVVKRMRDRFHFAPTPGK